MCRLKNTDYDRHSLAMQNRIAAALEQRMERRLVRVSSQLNR